MNCDEVSKLERTRRKALWSLASLHPGDPNASELLIILDTLERDSRPSADKALELSEVRDLVSVRRHNSGIDTVLELDIPQPWRERFFQASVGSTKLIDGFYACDWDKFLAGWDVEMRHLEQHRVARYKPGTD
ncbi:hypothetical protein AAY86_10580 [Pseudomonas amygdali pv. tabaci str. ATCC 11528]|jgi:hypothetical protein|uniref:Uncharacterized protein n=1 Tax=Pseudomonas koreensis TaxID=198620 RepID=A0AAC9FY27_9PSED|nr:MULTISPECIES: hypothetical protein [Pseudomonas]ANH99237.1 hypothetical protein A8L59_18100 [Pseudomonas koreensis]KEZ64711.1 hypothetical protein C1E_0225745 [Pseudomonas amygdali pv. tabaci str. ATCC 11528]KKY52954.1 hypothetical protein AAY86_10580 [Pseudomonas amygdali pv. tabaci str. ATCC 11528]QED85957.1 hypothetical protein PSYTB_20960 [Pseudomonas amygdali pv. tabaci str. ATCC 11528]